MIGKETPPFLYNPSMRLVLETFTVPPFGENCYLVGDAAAGTAAVVDPGGRVDDVLRSAKTAGVKVDLILGTHAHIDHVSGVAELAERSGAPFWLHQGALPYLDHLPQQAQMFGLPPVRIPRVDGWLTEGQRVAVGGLTLTVREAFGHAPGHVILVGPSLAYEDHEGPLVFCGDVVFRGSVGRVDLPGGDEATLRESIRREILSLPDASLLLSGHGPATTVGLERRQNPFLRQWFG